MTGNIVLDFWGMILDSKMKMYYQSLVYEVDDLRYSHEGNMQFSDDAIILKLMTGC